MRWFKRKKLLRGIAPPEAVKTEIMGMFKVAWDQVQANLLLKKNGFENLMNTGLSLKDAEYFIAEAKKL